MRREVFDYDGSEVCVSGVPLSTIASDVPTPFYLYDVDALLERYTALEQAFGNVRAAHCVALKANSQPALLRPLADAGAGAEVVSGAELTLALATGFRADQIVFSGVGKTDAELVSGLEAGIKMFLVESEEELRVLDRLADEAGCRAPVALRLNPDIDAGTHPHIATGVSTAKFGIDPETASRLYASHRDFAHSDFVGVHSHIGSQITSVEPLAENAAMLAHWIESLLPDVPIRHVDIGGGLGITYDDEEPPGFERYAEQVLAPFAKLDVEVVTEPGRSLFGPIGGFVAQVLYMKEVHRRRFAVVDAGLNDLLRPALYAAYHRVVPVSRREGPLSAIDVAGAVCESSDIFARGRELPPLQRGDKIAILDVGAYGFSMSSNYNLRPRPAEVVVERGGYRVARNAETAHELVARELGHRP